VLEEILDALVAARDGDFSRRLSRRRRGLLGEIAAAYNELVSMNASMEKELGRMRRVIGREGRMDQRASLGAAGGGWNASVESLNALIDDLVRPTTEVASVLEAVADGDLDRKMALTIEGQPVKGEFLRIGTTVNTMVLRGRGHARSARGGHRGQARRPGRGEGRVGHLARAHRVGERHGVEPHRPGAEHLARGSGGRAR
jgi:methyl-accepting chemotaxis protein